MTRIEPAGGARADLAMSVADEAGLPHPSAITRRIACVAITTCLLAACADAGPPAGSQRGVRRCDRNGDLEERLACKN
jgi:hypothetical protein